MMPKRREFDVDQFLDLDGPCLCEYVDAILSSGSLSLSSAETRRLNDIRGELADEYHIVYGLLVMAQVAPNKLLPDIAGYLIHEFDSVTSTASNIILNLPSPLITTSFIEEITQIAQSVSRSEITDYTLSQLLSRRN